MSSTEKMISVPRQHVEAAAEWLEVHSPGSGSVEAFAAQDLREALAKPTEQHQGEPEVLFLKSGYLYHTDSKPALADEAVGYVRADQVTHADPGEVERLRSMFDKTDADLRLVTTERDTLRAELAERDALFARILGKRDSCLASYWFDAIEALLSASAEPSAPVEIDERAEFENWADRNWPGAQRKQLERDGYDAYKNPCYRDFWTGWQARAALERKP